MKAKLLRFLLLTASLVIISQSHLTAQKIEITPFYGYGFNGKIAAYQGDLNIRNDAVYGATLDLTIQPGLQLEFFYQRSDTRIDFIEFRGPTYRLTDLSVNYFQLGIVRHAMKKNNIIVYGTGSLGATLFSPSGEPYDESNGGPEEDFNYQDTWLFSLTFGGGAKIFLSKSVGLRFEARLLMPITWAGGGFMIGTGGSGFYFGGGSAILQASLMGGLIIALGK